MAVVMIKLVIIFLFFSFNIYASCPLLKDIPYQIEKESYEESLTLLILNLKTTPFFYNSDVTASPHFASYQQEVRNQTTTNWKELIKKQNIIFERVGRDTTLSKKILARKFGNIRKINCLESLLFELHLKVQKEFYTEFLAMLFTKKETSKIIFLSFNKASGYIPQGIRAFKKQLVIEGWKYHFHLHNHPFNFDNPYADIAGTTVPSSTDLNTIKKEKRHGLNSALITNGFHTLEYNSP